MLLEKCHVGRFANTFATFNGGEVEATPHKVGWLAVHKFKDKKSETKYTGKSGKREINYRANYRLGNQDEDQQWYETTQVLLAGAH